MTVEESILEKLRALPVEKQLEVLDFAEFLQLKSRLGKARHSPIGLLADLNIDNSEEDIAEARREMWGNFPSDIEL